MPDLNIHPITSSSVLAAGDLFHAAAVAHTLLRAGEQATRAQQAYALALLEAALIRASGRT